MPFQLKPNVRYRMPVVFGPAAGPRQKPDGTMWTKEETGTMHSEWMAVRYLTDAAKLQAILPEGFSLRGEPVVSVSCAWLKNLYWLAGRGYGIISLDIPVTYEGKTETLEGSFCPVIWESSPDAIMTGREELGFSKIYADIPPIDWNKEAATASCSASWFGHTFFDISLSGMTEIEGSKSLPGSNGGAPMYYKYMPRTSIGGREGADVSYVTTAAPKADATTKPAAFNFDEFTFKKWRATGSLTWHPSSFEQLPLTFHIVNTLADLDILEVIEAEMAIFSGPGIAFCGNSIRAVDPK